MAIKPPSVSEMLLKLRDQGLVDYAPYEGALLTEPGREQAQQIERKHQLLETFLVDTLGVEVDTAHEEACEMEHTISENTVEKICAYLGHPRYCPDAHAITERPVLREGGVMHAAVGDERGRRGGHQDRHRGQLDEGLPAFARVPARRARLHQKEAAVPNGLLIRIKGSEIAIGKDIARKIMVCKVV